MSEQDGKIVATEVAEAEFERFIEEMDLDVDPSGMDDEDKASFKSAKRRLIRAMERGSLVINEDGEPVYTPVKANNQKPITFHEPKGESYMAMDARKAGHDIAKQNALMAACTRESPQRFAAMPSRDYKVCTAVVALFLG